MPKAQLQRHDFQLLSGNRDQYIVALTKDSEFDLQNIT